MKKILIWTAGMLLTSLITLVAVDYFRGDDELPEGALRNTFHSDILDEDRDIIVHFPPDYDSTLKYPVMYVLDGSSQDGHIANAFDVLSRAGYVSKVIVVGIPNMTAENRRKNLVPPFMRVDADDSTSASGGGDIFLDFIEKELIPFVEKNYPVTQVRLFSGHSRGGLLVMYSLVRNPGMFSARFCFSAPFWRQNNIMATKLSQYLVTTDTLQTFLYMSAGANETDNIRNGMTTMKNILEEKKLPGLIFHTDLTPNATHQTNAQKSTPKALRTWMEKKRN